MDRDELIQALRNGNERMWPIWWGDYTIQYAGGSSNKIRVKLSVEKFTISHHKADSLEKSINGRLRSYMMDTHYVTCLHVPTYKFTGEWRLSSGHIQFVFEPGETVVINRSASTCAQRLACKLLGEGMSQTEVIETVKNRYNYTEITARRHVMVALEHIKRDVH